MVVYLENGSSCQMFKTFARFFPLFSLSLGWFFVWRRESKVCLQFENNFIIALHKHSIRVSMLPKTAASSYSFKYILFTERPEHYGSLYANKEKRKKYPSKKSEWKGDDVVINKFKNKTILFKQLFSEFFGGEKVFYTL